MVRFLSERICFLASRLSVYFFSSLLTNQILYSSPKHAFLNKLHSSASGTLLTLCIVS